MRVVDYPVADIRVPDGRLRTAGGRIEDLAESIRRQGLIQPISVSASGTLIAGLRRVEAFRRLGHLSIPAIVWSVGAAQQRRVEIDENLERQELTVLERAEHLAERKQLYAAAHPGTCHGGDRSTPSEQDPDSGSCSPPAFVDNATSKTGKSRSTVAEEVRIGESLSQTVRDRLRGTGWDDRKTELVRISRLPQHQQREVADRLVAGTASSVQVAVAQLRAQALQEAQAADTTTANLIRDLSTVEGQYRCILCDPPWKYRDGSCRGAAERHYPTMSLDDLRNLPVGRLAHPDGCFLWLWCTWPLVGDAVPHMLLEAWGFRWVGVLVWNKCSIGTGRWLRSQTEPLILAVRGKPVPLVRDQANYVEAGRRAHSEKPDESYQIIERYCVGPRLELFARRARKSWDRWGYEAPEESVA